MLDFTLVINEISRQTMDVQFWLFIVVRISQIVEEFASDVLVWDVESESFCHVRGFGIFIIGNQPPDIWPRVNFIRIKAICNFLARRAIVWSGKLGYLIHVLILLHLELEPSGFDFIFVDSIYVMLIVPTLFFSLFIIPKVNIDDHGVRFWLFLFLALW